MSDMEPLRPPRMVGICMRSCQSMGPCLPGGPPPSPDALFLALPPTAHSHMAAVNSSTSSHNAEVLWKQRDISLSSLFLFLWWYYTCFWGDELGMWLFLTPLPVGKLHSVFKGCISVHPNSNKNQSNPVNYKVGMKKWTKQGAPQARVTKYRMRKRKTIRRTELEREEREQVMQQTQ